MDRLTKRGNPLSGQEPNRTRLERLEASFEVDARSPGRPVIAVSFSDSSATDRDVRKLE